ncbi:MAG TPA: type II toxin-antitoxin system VapC family toxin [Propionibacteriaceae bacterium]|nr:type II toxin-antitoxin system VapC family toxin [Propionibacteriaceae bacterium]
MGVTHLVDTHILLWLFSEPSRIPESVRDALADRTNPLLVSSASVLEVATKVRLGKLDAPGLVQTLPARLSALGATSLPITVDHALLAGSISWAHRDPFDRLLVAQATLEDATFVTVDKTIASLPVLRVLTW